MSFPGWRGRDLTCPVDQVANAPDATVNLTPVSQGPAQSVLTGWETLQKGQTVPLIGEETGCAEPCDPV